MRQNNKFVRESFSQFLQLGIISMRISVPSCATHLVENDQERLSNEKTVIGTFCAATLPPSSVATET